MLRRAHTTSFGAHRRQSTESRRSMEDAGEEDDTIDDELIPMGVRNRRKSSAVPRRSSVAELNVDLEDTRAKLMDAQRELIAALASATNALMAVSAFAKKLPMLGKGKSTPPASPKTEAAPTLDALLD